MKMFGTVLVEFESDTDDARELVRRFMEKHHEDQPEPGWISGKYWWRCSECGGRFGRHDDSPHIPF